MPEKPAFRRIMVGFDARPPARDALALGEHLAEASRAKLVLATVFPYHHQGLGHEEFDFLRRDGNQLLGAPVVERLGEQAVEAVWVANQPPSLALQKLAEDQRADLIVLGSSGRGPIGKVIASGTAQLLLSEVHCAVAVAPLGYSTRHPTKLRVIALAYDGSEESKAALQVAVRIAEQEPAQLRLISVNDGPSSVDRVDHGSGLRSGSHQAALDEAIKALPPGLEARAELFSGEAGRQLTEQVERDVDMLVMGSHGRSPGGRVQLGSVSARLLAGASCPVLLVPTGAIGLNSHLQEAADLAALRGKPLPRHRSAITKAPDV
jgi:nucleotide-binding universal stress UspA family protein